MPETVVKRGKGAISLSLVQLARGMAGDLTAVSELGVGSTFTVSLPAA